jgi:hypothetical protein
MGFITSFTIINSDVNEISENIDVMNKDKSQMILIRISKAFNSNSKQRYSKHEKQCSILSLYAVI